MKFVSLKRKNIIFKHNVWITSFCIRMLMKEVLFKIIHLIFIFYTISGEEQDEGERENELTYTTSIRALAELRDIENSYMKHLSNYVNSLQKKVKFLKK